VLMRSWPSRWLAEKVLKIDRRRRPPALAWRTLAGQWPAVERNNPGSAATQVILFPDTFTNYFQPPLGLAAARLLQQASCSVSPGPSGLRCCGRPLISNGLLDEAVTCARQNVARLYPLAAAGAVITACEPSCVLTLKDDYPALLRDELRRQAETVAAASVT